MKDSMKLFEKSYDWESLQDWDRDLSECIQSDYNPAAKVLDEHGGGEFRGTIRVVVSFIPEDGES